MHIPDANPKHSLHPVMVIAAVAVVLFCGVGSAAIMGWLPSSSAVGHADSSSLAPLPPGQSAALSTQAPQPQNPQAGYGNPAAYPAQQPAQPQPVSDNGNAPPATQLAAAVCHECGVVESIHEVTTRAQGSGAGAAGGAILGGLLGNQVGSGHGRQLATVAGAIGGAVAGNQIEGNMNAHHSYVIVVRMDDGSKRTIHQSAQPGWRNGDAVKVVHGQLRAYG